MTSETPANKGNIADVLAKFKAYDTNGDGTLEEEELAEVLKAVSPEFFTEDRISEMFYVMDGNFDGVVTIEEFLAWIWRDSSAEALQDERRHVLSSAGDQTSSVIEDITEIESCTAELERDFKIFDVIFDAFAADEKARDAVMVDVEKPPELQRSGTFMQVPFAEYKGGWSRLEDDIRKPAAELLHFLRRGGEVPSAYLGRRDVVGMWKSRVKSLEGGYLVTEHEHGRPRVAVYQILKKASGTKISVHRLPALSHMPAAIKDLAESDGHGGDIITINKAVPLLDVLAPARLAVRAMELSHEIDEVTELLVRQKPDNMTFSVEQFETPPQPPRRMKTTRTKTQELHEEPESEKSEVEIATSMLEEELARTKEPLAKAGNSDADKLVAAAEELLHLLLRGGPIPAHLEPMLLTRRNLTSNWLKRVKRLRGGLLLTEGRAGRQREVVYQILALKDARFVSIRRLKTSSASDVASLARDDGAGGLKLRIVDAVPLLDAVGPAPLAARATELAAELHELAEGLA